MKLRILFCVLLSVYSALGEIELVCPQSLDPSSSVTTYTELTPGPRTIVFRETRAISGTPFRLSIVRNGIECVLLDHIPSQRGGDMYYITVNIPAIRCNGADDQCRMVLWQIDTTSSNGYCSLDKCTTYNSSAAVSIRTNGAPVNCPGRWSNYNLYNWPYDPVMRYTSTLVSSLTTARGVGTFLLIGNTMLYNVNVTVPFSSSQPETVEFLYYSDDSTSTVITSVNIPSGQTGVMGSWSDMSAFTAYVFRNESMYVRIIASGSSSTSDGVIMGVISSAGTNMINDLYGMEYGAYTSGGWLDGDMFVGPGANASLFTQPHGNCSQALTRHYGCMLSGSGGGGTVAMSITGNRLWFSMDMYNLSSDISSATVEAVATDALDLTPFWSDGYRLRGLVDVSDEIQSRITSGLTTVSVSTTRKSRELSCTVDEGIIGVLDSFYEVPPVATKTNGSASAFLYFSVDGALNYQITLNSLSSTLVAAHIHGPAYQGISTSSIPFDISSYIAGNMEGGWNVQGTQRNLTSDQLRYFVEGLYYLNMHTTDNPLGELRGQVSVLGEWVCPTTNALVNQCYWPRLVLVDGVRVNADRTPSAIGGVVLDRYQRLQYSFSFWYIPDSETLTLHLMSPEGSLDTVIIDNNDASEIRDNVREISIVYPSRFDLNITYLELQHIEDGELWFDVSSTSNPSGLLSGSLPQLTRNKCTGMTKSNESVGGEDGWIPTGDVYPSIRLLQRDMLKFTYTSPESVYRMENANRLAGCVFTPSTSTNLSEIDSTSPVSYYYPLTDIGYLYFASRASCQSQDMRLTVYVVAAEPSSGRFTSDVCSRSLYTYSQEQRFTTSSGFAGAITATIVGLIIGIAIAAVAIVIGVYVIFKGQKTSGDSGDMAKP